MFQRIKRANSERSTTQWNQPRQDAVVYRNFWQRMTAVPLLTVTDHIAIAGRGLVLMPDFSVPDGWRDRQEIVRIVGPSGGNREVEARLSWTHFVIADRSVAADLR